MTDPVTVIETVCTTVVAGAAVTPFAWKRFGKMTAERRGDELLLHGAPAIPGVRGPLVPAGVRLERVETMVAAHSETLAEHGAMLVDIQKSLHTSNGHTLAQVVEAAADEVRVAAKAAGNAYNAAAKAASKA